MNLDLQKQTVLVVDDNPANLRVITDHLEAHGFNIIIAFDGQDGLETARQALPNIILLDIVMPKMDGFEVCRRLKANKATRDIPVIFMTALAQIEDKVKGFSFGAVDYVTKPIQREEVLARVTTHLRLRDLTHRLRQARDELEKRVQIRTAELVRVNRELQAEIAERKQAEQALRESETKIRYVLEAIPDMLFILDKEGVFVEYSAAQNEDLYLSPEMFLGQHVQDVLPPELAQLTMNNIERAFESGKTQLYEYQFFIGGTRRDFETRIVVSGKEQVVCIIRDITKRKHAEQERSALIKELEAKNAELEQFVYTVSHDLKSPLITIQGFLGFVEQATITGDIERAKADITRIASATNKMNQLLGELLELSRIGRLMNPPEEVSLGELAREAVGLVQGRLEQRDVEVVIAPELLAPDAPIVYGDRSRLYQVLENLVDNAIKYMGDQPAPRVEIGARRDDGETIFYVRDNGIGIDPRYHEKVFELFQKLDQQTEGAGVGLAIVRRVVEVHDGRIWVESEGTGTGSTFCFTLPKNETSDMDGREQTPVL